MNIYITRGGPGAGKSTWIKNNHPEATVVSADHFFTSADGVYRFDPMKLSEAHAECLRDFIDFCQDPKGRQTVIVDNTNTSAAEFAPYAQVGMIYGHNVQILTFLYDPVLAHSRNIHGAPLKTCVDLYSRLVENTKLIPPWWKHDYYNANSYPL